MTIKIEMGFPTVQWGFLHINLEAETEVEMLAKMDAAKHLSADAFRLYQFIQNGPDEALEGAVKSLQDGLGATVLTEESKAPVPSPADDVKPAWERPAIPAPTPTPSVTVSQSDIDDF